MTEAADYSLADFYFLDSDDPLAPSEEFTSWRKEASWAMDLYMPRLLGAPTPRVKMVRAGHTWSAINLTSYNYMGMVTHPEVMAAAHAAVSRYGTGACGSPLLSGMMDLHEQLESRLARFMNREGAVVFNSGFGGAMGGLAGMLRKGDAAIMDEKCHLSLIAGGTLGKAKIHFFKHNDPESLEECLKKTARKRQVVVVEGIYSMDGDFADLPALLEVTDRHGVGVFIDEAHSILAWGDHGRGAAEYFDVEDRIAMSFSTFSKAFAGAGGFVSGRTDALDYMRYYSHPYGFSCALPPSVTAGLLAVLDVVQRQNAQSAQADDSLPKKLWERVDPLRDRVRRSAAGPLWGQVESAVSRRLPGKTLRRRLHDNTTYLRDNLLSLGLNLGDSTTQVMPIIVGSDRPLLYRMCQQMTEKGLFLAPVDYPSVPEDELRYRVAVTAAHHRRDLDEALQIIEDVVVKQIL